MTENTSAFDLESFFPYRVRVFYKAISSRVSEVYKSTYGLTVQEWRVMSLLGPSDGMTATDIVHRSSMDKVAISRALNRLKGRGLINQSAHPSDRRQSTLRLNDDGQALFLELTPKVMGVEKALLSGLSDAEQRQLIDLMAKVQGTAEAFQNASLTGDPSTH